MARGRQDILGEYLERHQALDLLAEVEGSLDTFDYLQRTAVLWRCDAEMAMTALNESGDGCTVIYEELCDNTATEMIRIMRYLGLPLGADTSEFMHSLDALSSAAPKGSDARDPYFSVQRNPHAQRDRWKSEITPLQRSQIEAIVEPSWAYQALAAVAPWD